MVSWCGWASVPLVDQLGDIVFVDLPEVGASLDKGAVWIGGVGEGGGDMRCQ